MEPTDNKEVATAPVSVQASEAKPEESPVKAGYVVAVRENGQFAFELIGEKMGAVELLGIHAYADSQVKGVVMRAVNDPTFVVLTRLKEIGDKLTELDKKLNG